MRGLLFVSPCSLRMERVSAVVDFAEPALRETPAGHGRLTRRQRQSRPRVQWLSATRQRSSDLLHTVTGARQDPRVVRSLDTAWLEFRRRPGEEPPTLVPQLYVCRISIPTSATPQGSSS